MSDDKSLVKKGLTWSISGKVLNAGLKFISVPLLLNHFGEEKFGLIALAISVNIYLRIMELGFSAGNVRFISHWIAESKHLKVKQLVETSFLFYGSIGVINFLILLGLSYFAGSVFNLDQESNRIFQKLMLILSFTALFSWFFSVTSHILSAYKKIDFDEKLKILSNILIFIGVLLTIFLDLSIVAYFLIYVLSLLILMPVRLWKIKQINNSLSFLPRWHKVVFKEVLSYSIGIFLMGIFQMAAKNLRPIILGIQAPIVAVTEFKIIEQIAAVITLLISSTLTVLLPFATKYVSKKNIKAQNKIAFDVTKYLSVFLVLLVFGLISISKPLLEVYVGLKYVHLHYWLNIWALTLLTSHNMAISSLVLAGDNIKTITYFTAISSIISVAFAWYLSPIYEVGGVVIAYLIYSILQTLFYYLYYIPQRLKLNSIGIFVNSFIYPLIVGLVAFCGSFILSMFINLQNPYAIIIVNGTSFVFLYILITLFTTLKIKEIKSIIN